jgi:hypothetical protein
VELYLHSPRRFHGMGVSTQKTLPLLLKVKVMLSLCLTKQNAMKTYWGVEVHLHAFLTLTLDGGERPASRPGRFTPRERAPWYPLDRRLGGPQSQSGHDVEEKNSQPLPGFEPRSSDCPARSQSLYLLS